MPKKITNEQIYKELKAVRKDIGRLLTPEKINPATTSAIPPDFTRKLVMKKEYTLDYLWEEANKLFPCWKSDYIDFSKIKSDRSGDYVLYCRDRLEADEELKHMSADDIKEKEIETMTLSERILLEIEYFKETGNHLDIHSWTLCAGSRDSDSYVPGCGRDGSKFRVHCYSPDGANDNLRGRQVVIL